MDFRYVLVSINTLIMGIVFVNLLGRAWQGQSQVKNTRGWSQTTGHVVSSGVREQTVRIRRRPGTSSYRNQIYYAPHIVYEYEVNGRHHQHDRLRLGDSLLTSDYHEAERAVERYPAGERVSVYYDPANPAEATLDLHVGWGTRVNWLVALIVLAITIIIDAVFMTSAPIKF